MIKIQKKHFLNGVIFVTLLATTLIPSAFAHAGHDHHGKDRDSISKGRHDTSVAASQKETKPASAPETEGIMGMDEKPGAMVPLDLTFADQNGDSVLLKNIVTGPTVLSLLYYGCPNACGLLLSAIAQVLKPYAEKGADAPNVITISIGEKEGPAEAKKAQAIANESMQKVYPASRWHFLTGSEANIEKVTGAVGFYYVKKEGDYDHPLGIIILTPQGKVSRYVTGTDFLPSDITLSLMEASNGAVQPTIARVMRACFSVDPKSHRLVFKTLQVSATVIITLLCVFIAYLVVASRSRRREGRPQ